MSAGTLTLTNNSAAVAGNGTAFTTEVAAGDFIVVTVGGVPYTLPVKSVESGTALTLVSNFTGPTQSGAAWSAVPRVVLNMVTAAMVVQNTEALRGLNYDKQNWQQVYSAAGSITVKLPDGSTYSGPSWKYLSDNMATKNGGAVPVDQGGTGATTESGARTKLGLEYGTTAGTVAQGNDARLNTVQDKSGGALKGAISVPSYWGGVIHVRNINGFTVAEHFEDAVSYTSFTGGGTGGPGGSYRAFSSYGALTYPNRHPAPTIVIANDYDIATGISPLAALFSFDGDAAKLTFQLSNGQGFKEVSWAGTSDRKFKENITDYDGVESLENIDRMELMKFSYIADEKGVIRRGVIAQQVEEIDPEYVHHSVNPVNGDEVLTLDTNALLMDAICAISVLSKRLKNLEKSSLDS